MLRKNISIHLFLLLISLFSISCKKYLETKSVQNLSTPSTVGDLQALLDNPSFNIGLNAPNAGSDEYYLYYNDWQIFPDISQKAHVWDAKLDDFDDWNTHYNVVFYANTVLDYLDKVPTLGQETKIANIKGSALFYRAYHLYELAQLYAPQFDKATASTDQSIPLRLNSNFNEPSTRSTAMETYNQLINDLNESVSLLPVTPTANTRPSKTACYALLARIYLQMSDYNKAKENADAALGLYNTLVDFNDATWINVNVSPSIIKKYNPEIIFYLSTGAPPNASSRGRVDTNLYKTYDVSDLRKKAYFLKNTDGSYRFKGSYSAVISDLFNGLATDELYLIRAECNARSGNKDAALSDLNTLLQKRWPSNSFTSIQASSPDEALKIILSERKKELLYRGVRWADLRRLNKDAQFASTITRNLNGQIYTLLPNDVRYTLLIPQEVITQTSLQQNQR